MAVVLMSKPGYWEVRYYMRGFEPATQLVRAETEQRARSIFLDFLPTADILRVQQASVVFDESVVDNTDTEHLREQLALLETWLRIAGTQRAKQGL